MLICCLILKAFTIALNFVYMHPSTLFSLTVFRFLTGKGLRFFGRVKKTTAISSPIHFCTSRQTNRVITLFYQLMLKTSWSLLSA